MAERSPFSGPPSSNSWNDSSLATGGSFTGNTVMFTKAVAHCDGSGVPLSQTSYWNASGPL